MVTELEIVKWAASFGATSARVEVDATTGTVKVYVTGVTMARAKEMQRALDRLLPIQIVGIVVLTLPGTIEHIACTVEVK